MPSKSYQTRVFLGKLAPGVLLCHPCNLPFHPHSHWRALPAGLVLLCALCVQVCIRLTSLQQLVKCEGKEQAHSCVQQR